jgi:hypothetical protein
MNDHYTLALDSKAYDEYGIVKDLWNSSLSVTYRDDTDMVTLEVAYFHDGHDKEDVEARVHLDHSTVIALIGALSDALIKNPGDGSIR